ncbi:MAG: DUF975 family protein [Clostridia bacterium]|nr:DUF975 family protein [Clostridia bacterium]
MTTRATLKQTAKDSLRGKYGIAIGTTFVAVIILAVLQVIPVVGSIGSIILTGAIEVGLAIVFLEIIRNWQCEFGDMFKGFNNFGTNCVAGILVAIYTALWSLLFVIPGIVKAYSYSMTYYILADHPEMTANQAIAESQKMMNGHKARLFVLELSFIPWLFLVSITIGLAAFYVVPYMQATMAAFYEDLKMQSEPIAEPQQGEATVL